MASSSPEEQAKTFEDITKSLYLEFRYAKAERIDFKMS